MGFGSKCVFNNRHEFLEVPNAGFLTLIPLLIRIHRAEITSYEIKRLSMLTPNSICKGIHFGKSSSIKQTICQKLRSSNENTFSFILHVCYFSYHPSIATSEARSLTTLFSTKMRGRKHSRKDINISVPFY